MTAASIVADLEGREAPDVRSKDEASDDSRGVDDSEGAGPADVDPDERRRLKAEAKAEAKHQREQAKSAVRLGRSEAKAAKKRERDEAREQAAAAKARKKADVLAARRVGTTAALAADAATSGAGPSAVALPETQPVVPSDRALEDLARVKRERPESPEQENTHAVKPGAEDRARAKRQARQAKIADRAARNEAKASARAERERAKAEAREARKQEKAGGSERLGAAVKDTPDDGIVEAPREPKVSFAERRRRRAAARQTDTGADPEGSNSGRHRIALLAGVLGALGLACSVILAIGALLVALGATDGEAVYDVVSSVCNVLVGPLRDVFSFSGANADMKEALVAWGLGSMCYLLIGLFAQSFLRSRIDD